jgi:outer membrane protein OmpA-like peptidoglycan-associated protein
MLDDQDQGTRIGVWVALGAAAAVIFGLLFGLVLRHGKPAAKPDALAVATATAPAAATGGDLAFIDVPLAGEKIGALYFAVGDSALPADALSTIAAIKKAADAAPSKKLVLSGFHDATGDPAKNAELAKNRAKAVRTALQGEGVAPERIAMRKPESTTGAGSNQEARRVEVRLAD